MHTPNTFSQLNWNQSISKIIQSTHTTSPLGRALPPTLKTTKKTMHGKQPASRRHFKDEFHKINWKNSICQFMCGFTLHFSIDMCALCFFSRNTFVEFVWSGLVCCGFNKQYNIRCFAATECVLCKQNEMRQKQLPLSPPSRPSQPQLENSMIWRERGKNLRSFGCHRRRRQQQQIDWTY